MSRHVHAWRHVATEDDGSRLVLEERCETCGKRRRKPYRYRSDTVHRATSPEKQESASRFSWPIFIVAMAAAAAFGVWMGVRLFHIRESWGKLWVD